MSEGTRRLHQQLPVSRLSLDVLLALHFITIQETELGELQTQIKRVVAEPDLLHREYRPQWENAVADAIGLYARSYPQGGIATLIEDLLHQVKTVRQQDPDYQKLLKQVEYCHHQVKKTESDQSAGTPHSQVFPLSWRQQLVSLLLPMTTFGR